MLNKCIVKNVQVVFFRENKSIRVYSQCTAANFTRHTRTHIETDATITHTILQYFTYIILRSYLKNALCKIYK